MGREFRASGSPPFPDRGETFLGRKTFELTLEDLDASEVKVTSGLLTAEATGRLRREHRDGPARDLGMLWHGSDHP